MRIIQLTAENIKRISAVSITPDGNLCVIGGKNGAGKTSVLDAIEYALAGKHSLPPEPLRRGTKKGKVTLQFDGDDSMVVTRTFTRAGGGSLHVTVGNGEPVTSPQTLLDKLCGRIAFDPLEFTRMKSAQQAETLRELLGLDFSALDKRRAELFSERTAINRAVKTLEAQLTTTPRHDDAPAEEVSVLQLAETLREAETENRAHEEQRRALRQREEDHQLLKLNLENARNNVARLERELVEANDAVTSTMITVEKDHRDLQALRQDIEALVDHDTAPIHRQLSTAEETNRRVRHNVKAGELAEQFKSKKAEAVRLTADIDEIDTKKDRQLSDAQWPIEGLGFDDSSVTFNSLPFDQASSAEQLRVSVAMGFALNPKIKTVLIRDGSLLDTNNLGLIATMAEEQDGQVLIERVGTGAECSVIIEDGHVLASDEVAMDAAKG